MAGPSVLEPGAAQIRRLAEEIAAIAAKMAKRPGDGGSGEVDADLLRSILRARASRQEIFGVKLFADPAWDMLLHLLLARLENSLMTVSALCASSGVAATTALRRIGILERAGLVAREQTMADGRISYLRLTDAAAERLSAWFAACRVPPL